MSESYHSVVVIGAGAAGLFAAQQLKARVPDVLVVEAQDRVGGRIKQVRRARMRHAGGASEGACTSIVGLEASRLRARESRRRHTAWTPAAMQWQGPFPAPSHQFS